jgi:hypothetical protein
LILSGQRKKAALATLARKIKKAYETKVLTSLAKALFSGKADAVAAINALAKTFKYHRLSAQTTKEKMGHKRKGRQPKGAHNVILGYHLNATVLYQLH